MQEINPTTDVSSAGGTQPPPPAEWTIMIYQAGDNSLSEDCVRALTEMKKVKAADPNKIHVITQYDPKDPRMKTRRLVINRKAKETATIPSVATATGLSPLDEDSVQVVGGTKKFPGSVVGRSLQRNGSAQAETNTADPETLFDFISWSQENFKAKRYMLVLSAHASGVESSFLLKDENPPGSMSFTDLEKVLKAVRDELNINLDILGMDACLMSMIEICYQFRGLAGIIVSSQSLVPKPGWPYSVIVQALEDAEGEKLEAENVARTIVKEYINFYLENAVLGGLSVDHGALRVDKSTEVIAAIKALAGVLESKLDDEDFMNALILSHWRAQSYNGELFVDLHDLCDLLQAHFSSGEIFDRCKDVKDAIDRMVINSCFCGIDYQYSFGLSIYFPWSEIFSGYQDLEFAAEAVSGWVKFLLKYLEVTCREPRGGSGIKFLDNFRRDPPWRRDPPYHGPSGSANSMRNPPREHPDKKVTNCFQEKDEKRFISLLESVGLQ